MALQPPICRASFRDTLQENNVSWRAGIDYKAAPRLLLYANVAKGYKAGSFPIASAATFEQFLPVVQESLLSYEAGFKFSSSDRRFSASGAAFYYDYRDKQLRGKIVDPIFGVLDALDNIPKSRMLGFELDTTYTPVDGLTLGLSGSILDSKITNSSAVIPQAASSIMLDRSSLTPRNTNCVFRRTTNGTVGNAEPFIGAVYSVRSKAIANIAALVAWSSRLISAPRSRPATLTRSTAMACLICGLAPHLMTGSGASWYLARMS
jgi:iron complex outermembrane receptor protein